MFCLWIFFITPVYLQKRRSALRAAGGFDGNVGEAERAGFGGGTLVFARFAPTAHRVHPAHNEEHSKSRNYEADDRIDEKAVIDGRRAGFLGIGYAREVFAAQVYKKI